MEGTNRYERPSELHAASRIREVREMTSDIEARSFIQYDGRYWQVIVDGNQVGLWSKERWAKRDLREKRQELERREAER
jgi:hypothetical protein